MEGHTVRGNKDEKTPTDECGRYKTRMEYDENKGEKSVKTESGWGKAPGDVRRVEKDAD